MPYEQLSLFPEQEQIQGESNGPPTISQHIADDFGVLHVPFYDCDFQTIYPRIRAIIPKETVMFDSWDIETAIACETVCAGICHQMNWDYLRSAIQRKTCESPQWIRGERLETITKAEVSELFREYHRQERVRAKERTSMLHEIGRLVSGNHGFIHLFFSASGELLSEQSIRDKFQDCYVFSRDPAEKKLQILFQKLSRYAELSRLANYCRPAIDYHLIRCYLRRGLLYPETKYAMEYIWMSGTIRKEGTVGALRHLCGTVMKEICSFTGMSIQDVNLVEWHIGRSVCVRGAPDCALEREDAAWLKSIFSKCPFCDHCGAFNGDNDYLSLNEPEYHGGSY